MGTVTTTAEVTELLRKLPPDAKVDVKFTSDGKMTFTVAQQTKQQILEEKYGDLMGQPITLTEAAEKYGVPRSTVKNEVYQSNYINPLDDDAYPKTFDEAEVAYLVGIYHERKAAGSYAPLLDENGLPYR